MTNKPLDTSLDQNLVRTKSDAKEVKKKVKGFARSLSNLKLSHLIHPLIYTSVGLFSFLLFLYWKIPFDRFSVIMLNNLSQQTGMQWNAKSIDISLLTGPGPKVSMNEVIISPQSRSQYSSAVRGGNLAFGLEQPVSIQKLVIKPKIWSLIPIPGLKKSIPGANFDANIFSGNIYGSSLLSNSIDLELTASKIDLSQVTPVKSLKIDLKGILNLLEISIHSASGRVSRANGNISINSKNLILNTASHPMLSMLPGDLKLGNFLANGKINNGLLTIDKFTLGSDKDDVRINISGSVKLRNQLEFSRIDTIINLSLSPKLKQTISILESFLKRYNKGPNSYCLKVKGSFVDAGIPGRCS